MDYEKKYKEALGWMQGVYPTLTGAAREDAEYFFPELAESEDEKIRKELLEEIEFIIPHKDETDSEGLISLSYYARIDRYKSYLEKQKEPIDPFDTKLFQDGVKEGRRLEREDIKKERQPAEWSKEDKNRLEEAIEVVEANGCWVRSAVKQVSDFLKSLPERFNLQPKQEWSEKDEETLEKLHRLLVICRGEKKFIQEADYNKMDNLLKSLRPHWKPSEEQMESLYNAVVRCKACSNTVHLPELYEDLKTL